MAVGGSYSTLHLKQVTLSYRVPFRIALDGNLQVSECILSETYESLVENSNNNDMQQGVPCTIYYFLFSIVYVLQGTLDASSGTNFLLSKTLAVVELFDNTFTTWGSLWSIWTGNVYVVFMWFNLFEANFDLTGVYKTHSLSSQNKFRIDAEKVFQNDGFLNV